MENAMARYRKLILKEVEGRCRDYCEAICSAAIHYRKGHNFTGNLINSIAVCLYRDGSPLSAWLSKDVLKPSIQRKMTKGGGRNGRYYFKVDWDGTKGTRYTPEVETDEQWGEGDAVEFFRRYRPRGRNRFDIVVAYTTEYADFVEAQRGTTGIMNTYDFAQYSAVQFLRLPQTGGQTSFNA